MRVLRRGKAHALSAARQERGEYFLDALERWQSIRELAMMHAWLDSWAGLGAIVVEMQRHGYDLSLTHDRIGWRATFLHHSHVLYVGSIRAW